VAIVRKSIRACKSQALFILCIQSSADLDEALTHLGKVIGFKESITESFATRLHIVLKACFIELSTTLISTNIVYSTLL